MKSRGSNLDGKTDRYWVKTAWKSTTTRSSVVFAVCTVLIVAAMPTSAASGPGVSEISAVYVLVAIALSGFFGGFVDGLRSDRSYKWRFGSTSKEWGSLGDGLVGTAAAVAIFAFAESIFSSDLIKGPITSFTFVKIVAWGVLSGYAGTRLLDPLSSKVIKQLAGEAARQEIKQQLSQDEQARQSIREAEQLVAQHVMRVTGLRVGVADPDAAKLLDDAQRKFDLILKSDPANVAAQIGLANLHCYRGEYLRKANDTSCDASFAEAIKVVDAMIKRDPNVAKAHYNRACYKALGGDPPYKKDDAARDLIRAVELDEHLKEYAVGDKDLDSLRDHRDLPFLSKAPDIK